MANNGTQKLKLLSLLRILQLETDAEQGLTMPQLIERLEAEGISAERKSLYRDIKVLRDVGFEVKKLPTRPVQYALMRNELDIDDVMMLVDVVQSSPFLTERKSNHLVKSLKALVSERERKMLDKRVHVAGRIRNQNDSVFHTVDRIHEAMQARLKIEFLYYSYGTDLSRNPRHDGKRYSVTPAKVVYANSNYYLVAFDDVSGLMKTYRIDRMRIAQISEEPAVRNSEIANYDFGEFSYQSFGMFSGEPTSVTLHVKAELMDAFVDTFGRELEIVKATPNYADVLVKVQKSPQFFGWLAGLNGGATIRSPRRVKAEYNEWLQSLIDE